MKIHDLLIEHRLDEKPMGALKSLGNKAMASLGSGTAQGKVNTGTMANQLRKQFDTYLGSTGEEATPDSIVNFLKSKQLPTISAEKMLGLDITAEKPTDTGSNSTPTAATQAKVDAAPQGSETDRPNTDPAAAQPAAQDTKADIAARVKANVGRSAAATTGSGFGQPVEKPQPAAGAAAFGQMAQQLAKPGDAAKPTQPPPAQPANAKPAAGVQDSNPAKKVDTKLRDKKGRYTSDLDQDAGRNRNVSQFGDSIEHSMDGQELIEYVDQLLSEKFVVDSGTLDKIFMAAAQDAAKMGFKPGEEIGAVGGFKAGVAQSGSFGDNLAAAYKGGDRTAPGAVKSAGLQDQSGLIPKDMLGQINQLSYRERQQLLKELG